MMWHQHWHVVDNSSSDSPGQCGILVDLIYDNGQSWITKLILGQDWAEQTYQWFVLPTLRSTIWSLPSGFMCMLSLNRFYNKNVGPVPQWIRRLPTEQEIPDSIPGRIDKQWYISSYYCLRLSTPGVMVTTRWQLHVIRRDFYIDSAQ